MTIRSEGSGLSMSEDGRLNGANAAGNRFPGNGIDVPHDLNAAEMFVSDDGRLILVDDGGTVLWAGPPPTADDPQPKLVRTAAPGIVRPQRPSIDLSDYNGFDSLVVRTDYSDDAAWHRVVGLLARPWPDAESESGHFLIADPVWAGADHEEVLAALPDNAPEAVFIADAQTMRGEPTLLAVRTADEDQDEDQDKDQDDHWFRIPPETAIEMAVNLALGNMDFDDFA